MLHSVHPRFLGIAPVEQPEFIDSRSSTRTIYRLSTNGDEHPPAEARAPQDPPDLFRPQWHLPMVRQLKLYPALHAAHAVVAVRHASPGHGCLYRLPIAGLDVLAEKFAEATVHTNKNPAHRDRVAIVANGYGER
jgi:hypothetical protein